MAWIRTTTLVVLVTLLAGNSQALAEEPRVRQLVGQGERAFDRRRYDDAIRFYSEAYALDPMPALLFNLGQCHRQLGSPDRARAFFERYLTFAPEGKNAPVARELLVRVAQDVPRRRRLQPTRARTSSAAVSTEQPEPLTKKWWFWTGVGAVAAATVATVVVASLPREPPGRGAVR